MLFEQLTDKYLEKSIDQFIFIFEGTGYLFDKPIDREYAIRHIRDDTLSTGLPKSVVKALYNEEKLDQLNVEWACMSSNVVFDSERARDVQVVFMQRYIAALGSSEDLPFPPKLEYEYIGPPTVDKPQVLEDRPVDSMWEPNPEITAHTAIKNDYNLGYVAYIFLKSEMKLDDGASPLSSSFNSLTGKDLTAGSSAASAKLATKLVGSHSWIQIMNITPQPIPVGPLLLPSLKQICIGVWPKRGAQIEDWIRYAVPKDIVDVPGEMHPLPPDECTVPDGIRFNYESFERIMANANLADGSLTYGSAVTMGSVLTREQLNQINTKMMWIGWNHYDLIARNCSFFAWHMVKSLPVFKHVAYPITLKRIEVPGIVPPTPKGLGYSMHRAKNRTNPWDYKIDALDDMPLNRGYWALTSGCKWNIPGAIENPAWQLSDIWYKPASQGGMKPIQKVQHTCVDPFAGRV